MAAQIPTTTKQWTISSSDGSEGFKALNLSEVPVNPPGDSEVLVKSEFLTPTSFNFPELHANLALVEAGSVNVSPPAQPAYEPLGQANTNR